jgi:hypothetical protein
LTTWLSPFVALSALGLILSILAHVAGLLGLSVPSAAVGLHLGIFVVWFPAILASNSLAKHAPRKDYWKVVLRGAPRWMQYMTLGFFVYAVVNFILFISVAPRQPDSIGGSMSPSEIRGVSGHWMAFYSAALAMLYSVMEIQKKGIVRKCPNGHKVGLSAQYCEKCGEPVRDLNEL